MNTSDQTDEGWIEWGGGECPIDGEVKVHYIMACNRTYYGPDGTLTGSLAKHLRWDHIDSSGDIIAYRVVS